MDLDANYEKLRMNSKADYCVRFNRVYIRCPQKSGKDEWVRVLNSKDFFGLINLSKDGDYKETKAGVVQI